MSQKYLRITKKNQLEAEIKQAKNTLIKEKARCFKVLNEKEPFVPKFGKSAQKILDDFNDLCSYYDIDPDSFIMEAPQSPEKKLVKKSTSKNSTEKSLQKSPVKPQVNNEDSMNQLNKAYQSRMKALIDEENSKKAILNNLNKKLLLLKKKNDALLNEKQIKVVTIDKSFNNLKKQVNDLHDYFTNFANAISAKISSSKQLVKKIIDTKRNKSQARLDRLDEMIKQLQEQKDSLVNEKKEKLSRLSFQAIENQNYTYQYTDENVRKTYAKSANEVQKRLEQRLKSSPIFQLNDTISKKINEIVNRIDLLTNKVNEIRNKREQQKSAAITHNWNVIISGAIKKGFINQALDEYIKELEEENDSIVKQLNEELEIVHRKVPGTNLTLLQLRQEVARLSVELSDLASSKTAQLAQLNNELKEYHEQSQAEIQRLEDILAQ